MNIVMKQIFIKNSWKKPLKILYTVNYLEEYISHSLMEWRIFTEKIQRKYFFLNLLIKKINYYNFVKRKY